MKIVLIAYHFPPSTAVGGLRAYGLAHHLSSDADVIVITAAAPTSQASEGFRVITVNARPMAARLREFLRLDRGNPGEQSATRPQRQTVGLNRPTHALRRMMRFMKWWLYIPDEQRGWARRAAGAVLALGLSESDVLISSSPPFSAHLAAMWGMRRGPRPLWIADFRDLLTAGPYYWMHGRTRMRALVDRHLESRVMRTCDAVVVTSDHSRAILAETNRVQAYVVRNGYQDFKGVPSPIPGRRRDPSGALTFIHAGTLYAGERDSSLFLAALSSLVESGDLDASQVRVEFYGPDSEAVQPPAKRHRLEAVVSSHPPTDHATIMSKIGRADVLLLIQSEEESTKGAIPAKLFEYLPLRKPILAIGVQPESEVAEILRTTHAGVCLQSTSHATEVLRSLTTELTQTGMLLVHTQESVVSDYSQRTMTQHFHEIIDQVRGSGR